MMEKMKTTAPVSSVGADGVQPNVKNHNEIIANSQEQINREFDSCIIKNYLAGLIKPAFFMSNFMFLYVLVYNSVVY